MAALRPSEAVPARACRQPLSRFHFVTHIRAPTRGVHKGVRTSDALTKLPRKEETQCDTSCP